MGAASSYGQSAIVQDGLILNLDVANPASYSPNMFPYPTDLTQFCKNYTGDGTTPTTAATGSNCTYEADYSQDSPVGGVPLKMTVTGLDPFIQTYLNYRWKIATLRAGIQYTFSVYVKSDVPTEVEIFLFGVASTSASTFATTNTNKAVNNEWRRISLTWTVTDPSGSTSQYLMIRLDGPSSGYAYDYTTRPTIWWDGAQVEIGSTATPFNPVYNKHNRSLYDLSPYQNHHVIYRPYETAANWTTTLTNKIKTFNLTSSAQYFFRGVPTVISADHTTGTQTSSEAMNGVSSKSTIVIWYKTSDISHIWLANAAGNAYVGAATQETNIGASNTTGNYYASSAAGSTNISYYIDTVSRTSPLTPTSYVDGTWHMWEAKGVDLANAAWGTDYRWFGFGSDTSAWRNTNASIGAIMIYNRSLSADESTQNFNAFRWRYGI